MATVPGRPSANSSCSIDFMLWLQSQLLFCQPKINFLTWKLSVPDILIFLGKLLRMCKWYPIKDPLKTSSSIVVANQHTTSMYSTDIPLATPSEMFVLLSMSIQMQIDSTPSALVPLQAYLFVVLFFDFPLNLTFFENILCQKRTNKNSFRSQMLFLGLP